MIIRGLPFCLNYCIAVVMTAFLLISIASFLGLSTGHLPLFVMPLLVVSMIEGKWAAKQKKTRLTTFQSLSAAAQMLCIAVLVAVAGLLFLDGFKLLGSVGLTNAVTINGVFDLVLWVLGALVVLQLGFGFGLASELKSQRLVQLGQNAEPFDGNLPKKGSNAVRT